MYLVVAILIVLAISGGVIAAGTTWLGAISNATFWTNYYMDGFGRDGIAGGSNALWSLAVEEHYYLLFPLMYIMMRRWLPNRWHQVAVLLTLCVAIMAWRFYLEAHHAGYDRIYLSTDTRADSILWGSVLAIGWNPIYGEARVRNRWVATALVAVSSVAFLLVTRLPQSLSMTAGYTVQAVCLFGVFIPLILLPRSIFGIMLNWAPMDYLGVLSYALYLIHRPLILGINAHSHLPMPAQAVVGFAMALVLAYLMQLYVERPFGALRRRLNRARETENTIAPVVGATSEKTAST